MKNIPRGAHGDLVGMGRGAFVDISRQLGCFVELLEPLPTMWQILDQVRAAHLDWDGRDPMRPCPAF